MWESILEALLDSLKVLPILFAVYILIEFLEHKQKAKFENFVIKSKKAGPIYGAGLGILPQCAFSAIMSDLFSKKTITLGTLFAVFIATSDEAIPLMLSYPEKYLSLIFVIAVKFILAIAIGYFVDLIVRKQQKVEIEIHDHEHDEKCTHEHCCADNMFIAALKHTAEIFAYILIANILINIIVYFVGEEAIVNFLNVGGILQPIIAALIGLIPNCVSSVILVELYMEGALTISSLLGGLCASAGVGIVVLFRKNKSWKQNLLIILSLFLIGAVVGILFNLFMPAII